MLRITIIRPVPIKATSKALYKFDFDVNLNKMSINTVNKSKSLTNNRNRIKALNTDNKRIINE